MNDDERARLRALADRATAGPWIPEEGGDWDLDGEEVRQSSVRRPDGVAITWDDHGGDVFTPADAEFIAEARTAVPELLDELEEAEAKQAQWHELWRQRGVKHLQAKARVQAVLDVLDAADLRVGSGERGLANRIYRALDATP